MPFASFFKRFPDLVSTELRNIDILDDRAYPPIPAGKYSFLELFCDELDCDCRNVVIHVISLKPYKTWAILRYGWEKKQFYMDWFYGDVDNQLVQNFPGVFIDFMMDMGSPTSDVWLEIFKQMLHEDALYANRIKAHYKMFKDMIEKEQIKLPMRNMGKKTGRNDLCLCNSGKKFKKCCGLKTNNRPRDDL